MLLSREWTVATPEAMEALGIRLAQALNDTRLITLRGELGAGKTTLVRGLLRGLGYCGPVKSPSFTLVEPYVLPRKTIYHFDLYRLAEPEELELLGWRDYLTGQGTCLVEWPERAAGQLPKPDLEITIIRIDQGRLVRLEAYTETGALMLGGAA